MSDPIGQSGPILRLAVGNCPILGVFQNCTNVRTPFLYYVTYCFKDYAEDEAKKLVEKVEGILAGVTNLKNGLSAIRQKDIDAIRNIVEEIDNSDWIRILRERYGDSSLAQRLANDLEKMRSRCCLLMEKFADMLRKGFILLPYAPPLIGRSSCNLIG